MSSSPLRPVGFALRLQTAVQPVLCFVLPLTTVLFLASGPHGWVAALAWTLPFWLCVACDYAGPADCRPPAQPAAASGFDATLYALFALQLANIGLLLHAASSLRWTTTAEIGASVATLVTMRILVGTSSCCCGIAVAHELIHRRARHLRWMGRLLLWTVCYDHFAVEHNGGHHRRASTPDDAATAQFGERFAAFFWRSLRGQWLGAWRHETVRLRKARHSGLGLWVRHRVLHGVLLQMALLLAIAAQFGGWVLLLFLYQAGAAVRMLEAVNYIQHYGLQRRGPQFGPADAWATQSWFTLHSFIGLSRHADHHRHAHRHYAQLRYSEASPRLAHGYFVTVLQVRLANRQFMQQAERELSARQLGPFQPAGQGRSR